MLSRFLLNDFYTYCSNFEAQWNIPALFVRCLGHVNVDTRLFLSHVQAFSAFKGNGTFPLFLTGTRRSKILSRACAMSIEHLLCATVPKIAFVIVLKDACLKEISCNCNHTEKGVSLFTVKVSY